MSRMIAAVTVFLGSVILAAGQDVMTNESIVKMVKAGLSQSVIVESIQQRPGTYALSPEDLIALKTAGVSDGVITAMQAMMKTPKSSEADRRTQPDYFHQAHERG